MDTGFGRKSSLDELARPCPSGYGELAFRVKEGPTAQGTTAALYNLSF